MDFVFGFWAFGFVVWGHECRIFGLGLRVWGLLALLLGETSELCTGLRTASIYGLVLCVSACDLQVVSLVLASVFRSHFSLRGHGFLCFVDSWIASGIL